jgi:hypothetical protein
MLPSVEGIEGAAAMLITVRGRVEMDPMKVPLAASMAAGRDDGFEQVLEQTVAEQTERVDPRLPSGDRVDAEPDASDAQPVPTADHDADADAAATAGPELDPHGEGDHGGAFAGSGPAAAGVSERAQRTDAEPPAGVANAADSARRARPSAEPLLAAAMQLGPNAGAAPAPAASTTSARTVGAIGAARAADGATRGTDLAPARTAAPLRAPATVASYRTSATASAELLEHARDSVFKQIVMKLTGDGGEMHLRLEPPELGELDLRLVVQQGNRLDLTIATDRDDLAQLLHRHLDELKHTLQQAGLEVASTSVQTRGEFARERAREQERRDHGGTAAAARTATDDDDATSSPRRGGLHASATGLDFWA